MSRINKDIDEYIFTFLREFERPTSYTENTDKDEVSPINQE